MKRKKGKIALITAAALVAVLAGAWLLFGKTVIRYAKARMYPVRYTDEIKAAADRYGLDRFLVAAVVSTESSFRPNAVSEDGAVGLMQLLPSTAEWIAFRRGEAYSEEMLYDPETNLDYGCWFLDYLIARYDGSVRHALIAYNAGFGRLDEWLRTGADENGELKEIPYAETRNYVERVFGFQKTYAEIYANELGK